MKLIICNKTASRVSTDIGVIEPYQFISTDVSPEQAYIKSEQLQGLVDSGKITICTKDDHLKLGGMGKTPETTSSTTLHVSATGSDLNPGTLASPFLTLQAAIDSIPRVIRHLTTIKIGPGTFSGCIIRGFTVDPADNTKSCGLDIQGTVVNAVLGSGTSTGTFTSIVNGDVSTATFAVLTDSTQNWTVNGLRGKFVDILTGQGGGGIAMYPIVSNTATSITIASTTLSGSGLGTYTICDWATTISTPVKVPTAIAVYNRAPSVSSSTALIAIHNNNFAREQLNIQGIRFAPAPSSFYGIYTVGTSGLIVACSFGDFGIAAISTNGHIIGLNVLRCSFITTTSLTAVISGNAYGTMFVTNCFALGTVTSKFYIVQAQQNLFMTSCYVEHAFCISVNSSATGCRIDLSGSRFYSTNSACIWLASSSADLWCNGQSYITASGLYLNIQTVAAAILAVGPHMIQIANLTIDAGVIGIYAHKGARIQLGPLSTITGPTQVELDNVPVTLADMRAASPKLLTNAYGTIVHE